MSTPELRKPRSQRFSVPTQVAPPRPNDYVNSYALERTLSNESSQHSSSNWSYSHSPPPLHPNYQPPQLMQQYQSYPPPLPSAHYSHQQYSSEPTYYPPSYAHYPTHELPVLQDDVIPTAIVIKNIPFNVPKEFLLSVMEDLRLPPPFAFNYHFDNNQFRGLAFANFRSPADAALTVSALNGFDLQGRKLRTEFKKVLKEGEKEKIERDKALKRMRSQQDLSTLHQGAPHGLNNGGGGYGGQENGGGDCGVNGNGNGIGNGMGMGNGRIGAGWNRREGSNQSQSSGYGGNSYQSAQQIQHSTIYNNPSTAPRHFQYNQPSSTPYQHHTSSHYPDSTTVNNSTVGGGGAGEEDDYGQLLVNGPYSGSFNSFPGALEIGSRTVEDGFELLGPNEDSAEVGSTGSSANAVDPRYELDLNDSRTLEIFSRCLIFKDDSLRDELAFARSLSGAQRTTVHLVAKKLGLQHRSIGIGEERCVVVFKSATAPFPKTLRPSTSTRGSSSSLLQNPPTSSNVAFLTPTSTTSQGIRYKKSMPEIRHHHTSPFADRSGAGWGSHDINSNTSSREGSAEPIGVPSSSSSINGTAAGYGGGGRGMGGRRSQANLREGYATVGTGARRLRENSSVMGLFQTGFYDATPPPLSSSTAAKSTTASSSSTNATTPPTSTTSTTSPNGIGIGGGGGDGGVAGMMKGIEGLAIRQPKGPENVGGFTRRTSRALLRE